jgi:hypothetical protein
MDQVLLFFVGLILFVIISSFILKIVVGLTGIIFPIGGFLIQAVVITILSGIIVLIFKWSLYWAFVPGGGFLLIFIITEIIRQIILGKLPPVP